MSETNEENKEKNNDCGDGSSAFETGSITVEKSGHFIHCLTIIGQIEGHFILPSQNKTTKYEHVIPQLVAIEESKEIDGLLIILNTVGGDVVSCKKSFIVPSATMTVHPVRMNGTVLGVPQTLSYFEKMQDRIVNFVENNSKISAEDFRRLMMKTGDLIMDVGTVLDGEGAVECGLIDELGGLKDALGFLESCIAEDK